MDWRQTAGSWGARLLGLILIVAAVAKGIEPGAFAQQIQAEGLDFLFSARTVVLIALALEAGLGMALLLGFRQLGVLVPSGLLVAFFLFLTGRNYWLVLHGLREENASCGCFGSLLERTAAEAFWQDLLLLSVPFAFALWGRIRSTPAFPGIRIGAAAAVTVALVVHAAVNPDLYFVEAAAAIAESSRGEDAKQRFVKTPDYELLVNGKKQPAEIFHSEESVSLLIRRPHASTAILIDPRAGTAAELAMAAITTGPDGTLEVPAGMATERPEQFTIGADGISFQSRGAKMLLKPSEQ